MINIRRVFWGLLVILPLVLPAAPEGFEKLLPMETIKTARPQMKVNNWKYSEPVLTPYKWYLTPYQKNGEYRIVSEKTAVYKEENALFIKGDIMMDAALLSRQKGDDLLEAQLYARSNGVDGSITLTANMMTANGSFLGSKSVSVKIGPEWKQYKLQVEIPITAQNQPVARVYPAIGSTTGAFFDEVEFFSANKNVAAINKPLPGEDPLVFHFNFRQSDGKKELKAISGDYTCFSDSNAFRVENNALRVGFGARFRIPCKNNAFGEKFTISAWILKSSALGSLFPTPVLSRGFVQAYAGPPPTAETFDFAFGLNSFMPEFKMASGGLYSLGVPYNQNFRYSNPEWQKTDPKPLMTMDRFHMLTAVYDAGRIKLYVDDKLVADKPGRVGTPLMICSQPLYIGALRVNGEVDNQIAAEMLINDLKVYRRALTDAEVAAQFNAAKKAYPAEEIKLAGTKAYYSAEMLDYDPEMVRRLPQTSAYASAKPVDPFAGEKSMSGRYESSPRHIRLMVNGKVEAPVTANPLQFDPELHRTAEFALDFAAAGLTLFQVSPGQSEAFWKGEREYDWTIIDNRIKAVIAACPQAKLLVNVYSTSPNWFKAKYPEELEEYYIDQNNLSAGKLKWSGSGGPLGSNKYLELSCQMIRDFVKHMEASPFNNHIYGYSVSGGDAGEWYWPGQFTTGLTGYSKPTRDSFRDFLRKRYNNDAAALQKAWNNRNITFDQVEIPSPSERNATENYLFRDKQIARAALDHRDFINARTMLNFNESCRAARESASSDKVIVTYYGYSLYYAGRGVLHVSGLQTVWNVINSPWVDSIATPIDYLRRRGGQEGVNIAGFTGSALLAGKMIWREEDLRTHFHPRLEYGRTATLRETMEVIRRAYAYTIADCYGMWFVCQGGNQAYHQKDMMEDVKKLQQIAQAAAESGSRDVAEVALIFDEKDSLSNLSAMGSEFIINHIWGTYQKAHRMGAPFKLYFMEDLANPKMPDFKLYVFLNPYAIDAEKQKIIAAKVKKNQAVVVWNYAPGYVAEKGFDLENMKKLTGFTFTENRTMRVVTGKINEQERSSITALVKEWPVQYLGPVFGVDGAGVKVLATDGGSLNILAAREFKDWKSVYSLLPLTSELLTGLCDYAGVHVYSRSGDLLLVNSSYLALHSSKAGRQKITLPTRCRVTELLDGRDFGPVTQFEDDIPAQTTRIYRLNQLKK